ncbi:MAG: ABC transporter permease [Nitrospirae bacterium]|nr:ABC transporter permease [Nitrospirota bacterium]
MRYIKEISASPFLVLSNLYHYRHILSQMVLREVKGRFAGSIGGLFWHFVHPVIMVLIYLFVFVYIFKLRIGMGGERVSSAIYIMSGIFPWVILSEGLSRGTSSLIENANLIQKTYFPTEILPTKAVIAPLINYGVALLLLAAFQMAAHGLWKIALILPLLVLVQIYFTLGIVFFSATLSVFFRDVLQLVNIVVGFWIYVTPIFYPTEMLPEWAQTAMYINPLFPFVSMYHSLFLEGSIGPWHMPVLAVCWTAFFFLSGSFVFSKLKPEFADWL